MSLVAKYHNSADAPIDTSMKLFVGQVPKSMEEGDLEPYFSKYGEVTSVKICRDRDSKAHKGCAFLTFAKIDDAENALSEMHDRVGLPGAKKEMQIKPVHSEDEKKFEKRLFVGMISKSLSAVELENMFSKFGEVSDCNILYSPDKSSRGCGFIKYEKASSCLIAIKEMHQSQTMEGCNSPMVVKHADSPAEKLKRHSGSAGPDDRQSKRPYYNPPYNPAPIGHGGPPPPPPHHHYNQPPAPPSNSTAMALINAFTPLLASVAEHNNPGTTKMLVKSIEVALNALQHENTPSAHAALVSIASNLSVAVANNLSQQSYNQGQGAGDYSQYDHTRTSSGHEYPQSLSSSGYQGYPSASGAGSASYYNQQSANSSGGSHHYNYSSQRPN